MTERGQVIQIERHEVNITRPDKVLFPDDGIRKRDLVEYYRKMSSSMVPYLQDRPLTLERYPDGIDGERIIQKSVGSYYPDWIKTAKVKKVGGSLRQVLGENEATLAYLANQACITPHVWLSRLDRPDFPDQLIFDLDPSADDFEPVRDTANALREQLEHLELSSFIKSTGSRGVHITVPLKPEVDFDTVRVFARRLADVVTKQDPKHRTTEQRKSERRGRVFLDINRNAYAQTAVAPYAVRARSGAPVAVPISWRELDDKGFRPDGVTIRTIFDRLKSVDDPWKNFWRRRVSLKRVGAKLEERHAA